MTRVRVDGTGGGRVPVQVRRLVALEVTDRDAEVIVQGLQDAADMADDARGEVYAELAATIQQRTRARLRVDPLPRVQARPARRGWVRRFADAWTRRALVAHHGDVLALQVATGIGWLPIIGVMALTSAPAVGFLPAFAAFVGWCAALPWLARTKGGR